MKNASLILRLSLAFAFSYAAISSFIYPEAWVGWLPEFVRTTGWLTFFGLGQVFMSIWLVSGYKTFYAASLSAGMLLGIVVINLSALDVVFRDISLALSALALAVLAKEEH
ncbi:MAG: hypothetical protein G01um10143_537 [Parcubacteria group bacterium Gr01-1014_3]|nr:MAG: hypothetical protein G01um10143_537 [Parcubacteria group bacterium Gr01-1014_3]